MPIMTLNGNVTFEECPECAWPDPVKVEHGHDEYGPMHYWHCPNCGDSMVIVAWNCPMCKDKIQD